MKFMGTTVIGLEDVAAREVEEILGVQAETGVGRVFFECSEEAVFKINLWSRCLNRLFILLCSSEAENLDDVYKLTYDIDYSKFILPSQSFAVRGKRYGEHSFTSMDLAAKVGQAIIDSYKSSTGVRLKVDLDNPDVEFYCFVRRERLYLGINTSGESLHKRNYRLYQHPASLKATIAAPLIRVSNWKHKEVFLDPMCGGGTIVIEAALIARNIAPGLFRREFALTRLYFIDLEEFLKEKEKAAEALNRGEYEIYGSDISEKHVKGAAWNAESADVLDTIKFLVCDSRRIHDKVNIAPDVVVTNPPYGIRSGRIKIVKKLYLETLLSLREASKNVRVVAITGAVKEFEEAVKEAGYTMLEERLVHHGALPTKAYVCTPK